MFACMAIATFPHNARSYSLKLQVGRDFLPRGPEICTRRPLVLQLVNLELTSFFAHSSLFESLQRSEHVHCLVLTRNTHLCR